MNAAVVDADAGGTGVSVPRRALPSSAWPLLAVVAACIPFLGGFSTTNIFYVRDLTMFFWPRHLWLRQVLQSGHWPLWDPYVAAGQAVFPDALNQTLLPPVLLLRLLLPAVPGFNVIVLAPFPLAAVGTWLFLRRHGSAASAAFGAIVFAASGPVVSSADFPNLSWSIAWIPWLLWAVDADRSVPSARRFAMVALLAALQILSGEPVTMMGTWALVGAYALTGADSGGGWRTRVVTLARTAAAIALACAVAAAQLLPMALAARQSPRGLMRTNNFWSLHPLWLIESILPHVFGNSFEGYSAQLPWIQPLNSGREPFFASLYVGPVVVLLGAMGALAGRRRWRAFWIVVAAAAVALSFGDYSPVYPMLQRIAPPVRSFRFPVKFFVFASFSVAVLAANAVSSLSADRSQSAGDMASSRGTRPMLALGVGLVLALAGLIALVKVAPFTGARWFYTLGRSVGVDDPVQGAAFLFDSIPPIAARALILLLVGALLACVAWARERERRFAGVLLFGLAAAELVVTNAGVNPVMPASLFGAPTWTAAVKAHPDDRFYFGAKFGGTLIERDVDLAGMRWRAPAGFAIEEGRAVFTSTLVMTPAPWGVRELISHDLPVLWPTDYARAEYMFEQAQRPDRLRFLARGGVRYCLVTSPPYPGAQPLGPVGDNFGHMSVYECVPDARRAFVVPNALVVPDTKAQLARLFEESFPAGSTVMLEAPPPAAAGSAGEPSPESARITTDDATSVVVEATAGADGGFLVLLDSFDPSWRVDVDGERATLLKANGLYRAVRLAPGGHRVTFTYRPRTFYASLLVSAVAALGLALFALRPVSYSV